METVVRNVRDLQGNERSAAEGLVGHSLRENQKLVIQVVNLDLTTDRPGNGTRAGQPEPDRHSDANRLPLASVGQKW